jgi:hypothetical protein
MDDLFSSIQQSLQKNDTNSLLQNQQINQDKINELLEKSAEALTCGPTCQKLKITEELKQKYLDAETNMQIAPTTLEQSKKNYYIYKEGRPFYDNMLEEELNKKSEKITHLLAHNFKEELSGALTMNKYLHTALINSGYTQHLLKDLAEKNQELKLKLRNAHGDILTNDRKTYYETEALDKMKQWYKLWWYVYYIFFIVFLLALFLSPNELTTAKKIIFSILLLGYPYYIDYIVMGIHRLYMKISGNLPKNVYNNL